MTLALLFMPVSIVLFFALPLVQVDDREEPLPSTFQGLYLETREILTGNEIDTENISVWSSSGPSGLVLLALPILVVLGAYYAYRRQPTGRTLTIAMLVLAATVFFSAGAFFLPSLVAIGFASFQVRKAEMIAQQQQAAEQAGAGVAAEEDEDEAFDDEGYEDEYDEDDDVEGEYEEYDEDDLDEDEYDDEDEVEYEDGDVYDEFPDDDEDEDVVAEDEADEADDVVAEDEDDTEAQAEEGAGGAGKS